MTALSRPAGNVVAVTGASGYIGGCLLRHFEDYGDYDKLVAIDNRPLPFPVHNAAAYRLDVSEPIGDVLGDNGVTALVHLAFATNRSRNRREVGEVRAANFRALESVLESCAQARVGHVLYISSHTVYGARPGNPVPLTTEAALWPPPDMSYAQDNANAEEALTAFSRFHQDINVTVLRSCKVLGPTAGSQLSPGVFPRWMPGVEGFDPPLQFLYEEDLARILNILIARGISGTFNVAGDGLVFYTELAEIVGSRIFWLPPFLARPMARFLYDPHFQIEPTSSALNFVRYPVVMGTGKLRQATGYRYWHTSREALVSYANSNPF